MAHRQCCCQISFHCFSTLISVHFVVVACGTNQSTMEHVGVRPAFIYDYTRTHCHNSYKLTRNIWFKYIFISHTHFLFFLVFLLDFWSCHSLITMCFTRLELFSHCMGAIDMTRHLHLFCVVLCCVVLCDVLCRRKRLILWSFNFYY